MTLNIALVAPEVLGTYGDRGNALVLSHRAQQRGIAAKIHKIHLDTPIPASMDIYIMGGGEDTAQILAAEHLRRSQNFRTAIENGTPLLAICASLQILGHWYIDADGRNITGLDLLDITTSPQGRRSIGELVTEPLIDGLTHQLTGFENHGGITSLGPDALPLARVISGEGNGGSVARVSKGETCAYEGVVQDSIIATYMHGPVLARNPELADLLLQRATGINDLEPLEMPLIDKLREEHIAAASE